MPRVLLSRKEFRRRLGGISAPTEWRMRKKDPERFPPVVPLTGHLTAIDEGASDAYIASLVDEAAEGMKEDADEAAAG